MNLHGRSYKHRTYFLKKLGFDSYQAYLRSPLWVGVREKVFAMKGRDCHLCGGYATQLHHTRYHEADLVGRRVKHIHPICGQCHAAIEFLLDGTKLSVSQAKKRFKKLRRQRQEIEHLTGLFV